MSNTPDLREDNLRWCSWCHHIVTKAPEHKCKAIMEIERLREDLDACQYALSDSSDLVVKIREERDALAKQLQESVRRESGYREELAAERAYCEKLKNSVLGVGKER